HPQYGSLRAVLLVQRPWSLAHLRQPRPHETHARECPRHPRERSDVPHSTRPMSSKIGQSRAQPSWDLGSLTLHHHFGLETFDIAKDRRDRKHTAVAFVAYQAVLCRHIAVDRQFVPSLGMTHAVDWDVIVLAPKERHRCELLATSEHVERRRLPLAFGDDPVLHPDVLAA